MASFPPTLPLRKHLFVSELRVSSMLADIHCARMILKVRVAKQAETKIRKNPVSPARSKNKWTLFEIACSRTEPRNFDKIMLFPRNQMVGCFMGFWHCAYPNHVENEAHVGACWSFCRTDERMSGWERHAGGRTSGLAGGWTGRRTHRAGERHVSEIILAAAVRGGDREFVDISPWGLWHLGHLGAS